MTSVLRRSWSGHGWVIWLSCAAAITAACLGAWVLALALLLVEFTALADLSRSLR